MITVNANLGDVADGNGTGDSVDFVNWIVDEYAQFTGWPGNCR